MKTPNNSDSKFVAVIGAEPGDVIEEVAANVAKRAGAEFSLFDLPDDMIDRLTEDPDLGFTKTSAILCTTFAGRSVLTSIRKLRQLAKPALVSSFGRLWWKKVGTLRRIASRQGLAIIWSG